MFSWDGIVANFQEPTNIPISPSACDQLEDVFEVKEFNEILYAGYNLSTCLFHLDNVVITQSASNIPEQISELQNHFLSANNNPMTQPYIEHLTYLLGYHYELSGDEETAVNTYLNLIQQFPTSPWSWLAWARLMPMPSE